MGEVYLEYKETNKIPSIGETLNSRTQFYNIQ